MQAPPIRLLEQHYDRIAVEAMEDHTPGDATGWELKTTVSLRQNPDHERIWAVLLEVRLGQEEGRPVIPYVIAARAVGTFEVHPQIKEDEGVKIVAITGTSILYSGLRDFVATITGRSRWGTFLLPTVSFGDLEPQEPDESGPPQEETP